MSDWEFLVGAWTNVRSNEEASTEVLDKDISDEVKLEWFQKTASTFGNGIFRFEPVEKVLTLRNSRKKRVLFVPSSKDKIVQEGIRTLLETLFQETLSGNNHGWVKGKGCHTALENVRILFSADSWYIKGDISDCLGSIDHAILVNLLEDKIKDQAFIDLIYKYCRAGYGERGQISKKSKTGLPPGEKLSFLLANIYMSSFDVWVNDTLKPLYYFGKRKRANPAYTKMVRHGKSDNITSPTDPKDPNYKRFHYVRYGDSFIMGLDGPWKDGVHIKSKCMDFF
jgi:retron-type reverse transcriptase